LQPVTATAVGVALEPVALPMSVLAEIADSPLKPSVLHPGADEAPVDTID
jgi:hypothetical protein